MLGRVRTWAPCLQGREPDAALTGVCTVLQRQAAPVMDRRDRFRLLLRLVRGYLAWAGLTSKLAPLQWPATEYTVSHLLKEPASLSTCNIEHLGKADQLRGFP